MSCVKCGARKLDKKKGCPHCGKREKQNTNLTNHLRN